MAAKPSPGTGTPPQNPPTGNAISDANAQAIAQSVDKIVAGVQAVAGAGSAECLWPPPATWGVGVGPVTFSFATPCLITKSEARAFIGAAVLLGGIVVMSIGLNIIAIGPALVAGLRVTGITRAPAPKPAKNENGGPPAAQPEPAAQGTLADEQGTSPEFRAAFL